MDFEWDEAKNLANFKKHGIRFDEAVRIFTQPLLTWTDTRTDYGERREVSIGLLDERVVLAVVHTERDGSIRLISARSANSAERKAYDDYYQKNIGGN